MFYRFSENSKRKSRLTDEIIRRNNKISNTESQMNLTNTLLPCLHSRSNWIERRRMALRNQITPIL